MTHVAPLQDIPLNDLLRPSRHPASATSARDVGCFPVPIHCRNMSRNSLPTTGMPETAPLNAKVFPVRVLHLIETGGPGGAERILLALATHLGQHYHSTVGLLRHGWLESQVLASGLDCSHLDGNGHGDLAVLRRLLHVIRSHNIDLMHAHEFYMNMLATLVSCMTGIPTVCTVHGKNYYPERWRRRMIYRLIARRAAQLVVVSRELQRFFCDTTGVPRERVGVILNGIDTTAFSGISRRRELLDPLGIPREARIVGTIGNLYEVKGQTHLVHAARLLSQCLPELHVIILGRGGMRDALRSLSVSLGIQDRIHLLGFREDAASYLGLMDVFTLPSLSEGLPISLLEAMAAEVPVVVTQVGGMPEVVEHGKTGFLVPPGDPETLAQEIRWLLENPEGARAMGEAGGHRVRESFSLEGMIGQYHEVYRRASGWRLPSSCAQTQQYRP